MPINKEFLKDIRKLLNTHPDYLMVQLRFCIEPKKYEAQLAQFKNFEKDLKQHLKNGPEETVCFSSEKKTSTPTSLSDDQKLWLYLHHHDKALHLKTNYPIRFCSQLNDLLKKNFNKEWIGTPDFHIIPEEHSKYASDIISKQRRDLQNMAAQLTEMKTALARQIHHRIATPTSSSSHSRNSSNVFNTPSPSPTGGDLKKFEATPPDELKKQQDKEKTTPPGHTRANTSLS